jgi:hypothetical protein
MMSLPTSVEPVKESFRTSGCADHADRLAPGVAQYVLAERDGLTLELAG